MDDVTTSNFDKHAEAIAKRQYFQPGDETLHGMFQRVADWVAQPENGDAESYSRRFYELMIEKRFCPGGRILAGAATGHGNVLNCFVQDSSPAASDSTEGVLALAKKLALVTKVGGGNGLNLDPIAPKRPYAGPKGRAIITIADKHPDHEKVATSVMLDLTKGEYVVRPYRSVEFMPYEQAAKLGDTLTTDPIIVGDSVVDIWDSATAMVHALLEGETVIVDLSPLRAEGSAVNGSGGSSSGPSSFAVEVFDNFATWALLGGAEHAGPVATLRYVFASTLRTIRQGGVRRGAGMATLSATHPDVRDFITAKDLEREQAEGDISTFNISVLVTDAFMEAAETFLSNERAAAEGLAEPSSEGQAEAALLQEIAEHAWATGEPGIQYTDRVNQFNPMRDAMGDIKASNPCGEIQLYPGEPCDLGAINLSRYVTTSGTGLDGFDMDAFEQDVRLATRFLDNVLDVNIFALEQNREMSQSLRRLGLGVMGLADALIKMGYGYNSDEGRDAVRSIIDRMRDAAFGASCDLAAERGTFPRFQDSNLSTPRRNVAVLTVAPTGTTSMLFGVSSGVEPVFAPFIYRKIGSDYVSLIHPLFAELLSEHAPHPDYAKDDGWDLDKVVEAVQENHGSLQGLDFIPDAVKTLMVCAHDVSPRDHVLMQAVVQQAFDAGEMIGNSISKTSNLPNRATPQDVLDIYLLAHRERAKGITVYRDGSRDFQVLSTSSKKDKREGDSSMTTATLEAPDGAGDQSVRAPEPTATANPRTREGYDRPTRMSGFTDQVKLMDPNGNKRGFFVTVNQDEGGVPREVFIVSGKAGDEANADTEALGRVVSIALQHGVPPEALVKTLRGINGGLYGSYQKRLVASKADIIAVALESCGGQAVEKAAHQHAADECPNCGSKLTRSEGCLVCTVCNTYSKCG